MNACNVNARVSMLYQMVTSICINKSNKCIFKTFKLPASNYLSEMGFLFYIKALLLFVYLFLRIEGKMGCCL